MKDSLAALSSIVIIAVLVVGFIAGLGWLTGSDAPPAKARAARSDPWSHDGMRVLGTLQLPNGGELHAVRVPDWPSPDLCLVLVTPSGVTMRCDGDFPSNNPPALPP